jgi:hypothetical protein
MERRLRSGAQSITARPRPSVAFSEFGKFHYGAAPGR